MILPSHMPCAAVTPGQTHAQLAVDHTATKGKDLPLPLHVWAQVLGRGSTCKIFA